MAKGRNNVNGPKGDREFWNAKKCNDWTFIQYYNRLVDLCISQFEWINLPPTCDRRFLELTLMADGMAVFFRDEIMGYLALQCMISGPLDVYRIPILRRAYASNGYQMPLDNLNSVLIFNNSLRTNSQLDIEMYAWRLYEVQRAIDINIKLQKTPKIIKCSENQRLTIINLFKQYDGNYPFIFGDKTLDLKGLESLDIAAPYVADKLMVIKQQIWDEAMTYLGIANTNTSKRERLNTSEISVGMGDVEAQRYTRLMEREVACERINDMFGLKLEVRYKQIIPRMEEEGQEDVDIEVEDEGVEE
jgi:hypothetical protein